MARRVRAKRAVALEEEGVRDPGEGAKEVRGKAENEGGGDEG